MMHSSRSFILYSAFLLCLSTFTAAWPWPKFLPHIDSLIVRQVSSNQTSSTASSATPGPTATSDSASVSITSNPITTGASQTENVVTTTYATSYDASLPAGVISLITPALSSGSQYFRIGDYVTFAWNYTSLSATPTALNILASCSANSQLYTIAMNQTITNATGAITWDTGSYQTTAAAPLPVASYTLVIYDADSALTAAARPGYLAAYTQYTFAMYTPQPYTPLAEFKCATCSAAIGDMERRALGFLLGMGAITVLSFTWFVGGLNVIW